jgi:phosphorylcholine metabolism protein LicD
MRVELPTKSIITFMFFKWELNMITNGQKLVKKTNLQFFKKLNVKYHKMYHKIVKHVI